ncbi:hypothetical protein Bca4012_051066 [Brassica carinata]
MGHGTWLAHCRLMGFKDTRSGSRNTTTRSLFMKRHGTCPRNALQIGACTNVLNAIDLTLGNPPPPVPPCCSLIAGLADLEAAVCLCTALDVNVLGINVHLPIDISVLFNACSRFAPPSFQCP